MYVCVYVRMYVCMYVCMYVLYRHAAGIAQIVVTKIDAHQVTLFRSQQRRNLRAMCMCSSKEHSVHMLYYIC